MKNVAVFLVLCRHVAWKVSHIFCGQDCEQGY
jgi:hypothetical protein